MEESNVPTSHIALIPNTLLLSGKEMKWIWMILLYEILLVKDNLEKSHGIVCFF